MKDRIAWLISGLLENRSMRMDSSFLEIGESVGDDCDRQLNVMALKCTFGPPK